MLTYDSDKLQKLINVEDELNLYLVSERQKPATTITLSTNYGHDIKKEKFGRYTYSGMCPLPKTLEEFDEILSSFDIVYEKIPSMSIRDTMLIYDLVKAKKIISKNKYYDIEYILGASRAQFDDLLHASENWMHTHDDASVGNALGYPELAVKHYKKEYAGHIVDGRYVQKCILDAKNKNVEIPSWMAYISFVPEECDFVNNNISISSMELDYDIRLMFVRIIQLLQIGWRMDYRNT